MEPSSAAILEIGGLFAAAATAGWIARRIGLPAIIGYLAVGLAVSPFTPGYVANHAQIQVFADIGAVLLLFEVGLETDPGRLRREHGRILWAAPLQVFLTTAVGLVIALAAGLGLIAAVLVGLSIAMSSSVVIVNMTRSNRRTTNEATERALLSWSVLQDIVGVTVALFLLAGVEHNRQSGIAIAGIAVFGVVALAAARLLPRALRLLRTERDLFLLLSVASGLVLAGIGAQVFGVPLALAAFVSGLAVGEGPDASEARRQLLPFRDVFAVMFFVAIGTLVDPAAVPRALPWLGIIIGVLLIAKVGVIGLLGRLGIRRGAVRHWQLAAGLGQVGEFSFVIGTIAAANGVIPADVYTALLAAVILSVAVSAVIVRLPVRA
jgi:CPA2 family monovalent cation:H+ antiporter-2